MSQSVPTLVRPQVVNEGRDTKSKIFVAIWITTVLAFVAFLSYLIYITPRFQDDDPPQDLAPVPQNATPGDWFSQQDNSAMRGVLANFGHAGAKAYGAIDGVLLDSAIPDSRDHLWTRVRDSNIVFKTLVDRFIRTRDQQLQLAINSFIGAQASIQTAHSPSGSLDDGKELAEPRFLPNITADPTNYGCPKHDGPALRAIALVTYGRWLFENGYQDAARNIVWPIVRNDLNYIAVHYLDAGLNLWSSLTINTRVLSAFTTAAHHRALFEGAMFAKSIDEDYEEFISEASQVLCVLQNYWKLGLSTDPEHPFIVADVINITTIANHNGRDASTLLSAISNFDPEVGCNDETFQPCSQPMLRNHKEVVDQFRGWEINTGIEAGKAVAIGRFAKDTNGNPWFVTTLAAAELLYSALYAYTKFGSITIGTTSLPFWTSIYPPATTGLFKFNASDTAEVETYNGLYAAMRTYADAFVDIVRAHIPEDGAMAEQFDRGNGTQVGARDLSWSYGAWLSMMDRRAGWVPTSWGALGVGRPAESCVESTFQGKYVATDKIQWPAFPCKPVEKVQVTFNLLVKGVQEGEKVYVYGDVLELGKWHKGKMVGMDGERYAEEKGVPLWSVTVDIPAGKEVKYRYRRDGGGGVESKEYELRVEKGTCWYAAATDDTWEV